MNTTFTVLSATGAALGSFDNLIDVKATVQANPGAEVKVSVAISNACTAHPAYEADYCPSCGTSRSI